MSGDFTQEAYAARCEWGAQALQQARLTPEADQVEAVVIVDVLSFCTCTDVALSRGARVLPYRWNDDSAQTFAAERGALLASRRRTESYSLSPSSLLALPAGAHLVLPSPNGATLSALAAELAAETGGVVYAACLRNARAVAAHLRAHARRVLVVPAGERWPDGTLRPAAEDLWGAGAVLRALELPPAQVSPEAQVAMEAYEGAREHLAQRLAACGSGRELIRRGFADDVALAAQPGSPVVPRLRDGAYLDVGGA